MKKTSLNGARFAARRPYKIALCALVNVLLLVFCVVEAGQWLLAANAIEEAKGSRVFLGTLVPTQEDRLVDAENPGVYVSDFVSIYDTTVSEEAMDLLSSSPCVTAVHEFRFRGGRLPEIYRLDASGYGHYVLFVAESREPNPINLLIQNDPMKPGVPTPYWNVSLWPTAYAAGNTDLIKIPPTESSRVPSLRFPRDESEEEAPMEGGVRYLICGAGYGSGLSISLGQIWLPGRDEPSEAIFPEKEEDRSLDDRAFAEKAIRDNGLEDLAAAMDNARSLVTVVEIGDTEQLLMRKNDTMRALTGRWIGAEDRGKRVCMISAEAASKLGLQRGDKLPLSLSADSYGGTGVPHFGDTRILGYAEPVEYEIVGTYSYTGLKTSVNDHTVSPFQFGADVILVPPTPDALTEASPNPMNFTFEVPKESFETFMLGTAEELHAIGYDPIMVTPDYADVESRLEDLDTRRSGSLAAAVIALAAGFVIAVGELVLFWRADYATERTLGATEWESRGIYRGAWALTALFSLPAAALLLWILSLISDELFPYLLRTPRSLAVMGAFALGETLLLALVSSAVVRMRDRKRFPR